MVKTSRRLSWKEWLLVLVIFWLAFALRVHKLDARSLWPDEGLSLARARQSLPAILTSQIEVDGVCATAPMPPLYFIWLAAGRTVAGETVFSLRLASVWVGFLGVALFFVLGRRLFGKPAGLAAAFLSAISPYWVWYTQAARPDALLITTSLLSILALHRMLNRPRYNHWRGMLWLLATAAMLYTHRGGIWMLAFELSAVGIFMLTSMPRRVRAGVLVFTTLILLLVVPLARYPIDGMGSTAGYRPPWNQARKSLIPVLDTPAANEGQGDNILASLPLTRLRLAPMVLLAVSSLIWLFQHPRRTRSWLFALGYWLLPTLALLVANQLTPLQMGMGYLVVMVPATFLLPGAGAAALWLRRDAVLRTLALVGLLGSGAVMVYWLGLQFNNPSFIKDDLRAAAAYVSHHAQESDVVVLHNALIRPAWDYYYDGAAPVEVIPQYGKESQEKAINQLQAAALEHKRVWFLHRPEPQDCWDPNLLPNYAQARWIKFDEQVFSSLWLDVEVDGYMVEPPVVGELPAGATPANICWPGGLCLHGWSAGNLLPGREAQVTLYWSQNIPTDEDYKLVLSFKDAGGQPWSQQSGPVFRFYPAGRWPTGQILEQNIRSPLSPAMPPAEFNLTLTVQRKSDGQTLAADTGNRLYVLGAVTLNRSPEPTDPGELALQYKSDADFGQVVRLLGYNLPNDTPRPGHITFIDFYWQALTIPGENWQQRTRLLDREGRVWIEEVGPLGMMEFELTRWRPDDLVLGRVFLQLPGQMPAGEYKVEVTLLNPAGEPVPASEIWRAEAAESVIAGPAYLDKWPLITEPPPMPHRPDLLFGSAIRLWGYNIQGAPSPGEELTITLVWLDELPVGKDYHVFIHLVDENETLLGQADGAPAGWTRPTSTWRPGEYIVDKHIIPISPQEPAGTTYLLWVGLYSPDGGERLPVVGQGSDPNIRRSLLDVLVIEP